MARQRRSGINHEPHWSSPEQGDTPCTHYRWIGEWIAKRSARIDIGLNAFCRLSRPQHRSTATEDQRYTETLQIDNFAFTPATLTVTAGTTVTWKNDDDSPHRIGDKNGTFSRPRSPPIRHTAVFRRRSGGVAKSSAGRSARCAFFTFSRGMVHRRRAKSISDHSDLSALAIEILDSLPKIGGRYVLTTNGVRPVSGFSKSKGRLDRHMLDLFRAELAEAIHESDRAEIDDWVLHAHPGRSDRAGAQGRQGDGPPTAP
jgi:plastocyanin